MNITLLCPSPLMKDAAIKSICDDYIKRINGDVAVIDVTVKIKSNDSDDTVIKKQGQALCAYLDRVGAQCAIIALDERGKMFSSPELSQELQNMTTRGYSSYCFVIGGAFGLSDDVINRANLKLSFGKMVWPHRLVAPMLLEQLYRSQQINIGHPYHKA
jgi:23S rRNA (pseudouridine1915-N3)-methyltransferase